MENTKHTPGIWQVTETNTGRASISTFITLSNGEKAKITLATCDFSHIRNAFALSPNSIEEKEAKEAGFSFDYNAEFANAELIASAPLLSEQVNQLQSDKETLLEALNYALEMCDKLVMPTETDLKNAVTIFKNVIKATKP